MPVNRKNADSILSSPLDDVLAIQLLVAWAGEAGERGESERLGWWNTDISSEFGGLYSLRALLPRTAEWAALQAVRETAIRIDARARTQTPVPDAMITLFHLGAGWDERLATRLRTLKIQGSPPEEALPLLRFRQEPWSRENLADWLNGLGESRPFSDTPTGRRLQGLAVESPAVMVRQIARALLPLSTSYPTPHLLK